MATGTDLESLPTDSSPEFLSDPSHPPIHALDPLHERVESPDGRTVEIEPEGRGEAMEVEGYD
jgi:hypothetical protein